MDRYTTTEYGKQNMFASEPPMQYVENYPGYWKHAEQRCKALYGVSDVRQLKREW